MVIVVWKLHYIFFLIQINSNLFNKLNIISKVRSYKNGVFQVLRHFIFLLYS